MLQTDQVYFFRKNIVAFLFEIFIGR